MNLITHTLSAVALAYGAVAACSSVLLGVAMVAGLLSHLPKRYRDAVVFAVFVLALIV